VSRATVFRWWRRVRERRGRRRVTINPTREQRAGEGGLRYLGKLRRGAENAWPGFERPLIRRDALTHGQAPATAATLSVLPTLRSTITLAVFGRFAFDQSNCESRSDRLVAGPTTEQQSGRLWSRALRPVSEQGDVEASFANHSSRHLAAANGPLVLSRLGQLGSLWSPHRSTARSEVGAAQHSRTW
jgi:hypothetical protein